MGNPFEKSENFATFFCKFSLKKEKKRKKKEKKSMEETLESYKSKLQSLSSTMESQQKLIHDTIGQQLTLKKEFADKENNLNLKISELESLLKDKNSEISSLENQLKESKLAFERLNSAILSNSMLPLVNTAGLMMDKDVSNAIHQLQAAQQQVAQQQFQQEIQQQVVLQQMQVIESLINNSPPESNNDKTMLTDYEPKIEITPPITPQISKTSVLNPSPLSQVVSQNEFEENSQESEFMTALQNLSNSLLEKDYKESTVIKEVQISQEEWSQEQDLILKKTVGLHGHDWNIVTAFVPEKSAQQCAYRWKTVVGKKVKGRWYKAEDAALLRAFEEYVKEHGPIKKNSITAWSAIADKIPGRSGPACMVRYNESLDPRMK